MASNTDLKRLKYARELGLSQESLAKLSNSDLSQMYSRLSNADSREYDTKIFNIVSLITGGEDETTPAASNCTVTPDTENYRVGARGWKMSIVSAATAFIELNPISPAAVNTSISVPPAQAVCAWVYLSDASKVNYISLYLYLGDGTESWSRASSAAPAHTLVDGWNLIRFKTADALSVKTQWGSVRKVRVLTVTNGPVDITVGHVYLECPDKAKMIFVLDRGYKTFVTSGALDDLRTLGVPVTWAIDVTKLGWGAGTGNPTETVTEQDIANYAAQGDSISFHGWDGEPTSGMTDAQLRVDTLKTIKWLQARGYAGRIWRAAWVQNAAPNPDAISDLVLGQGHSSPHSVNYGPWPALQMHNIPRYAINGQSAAQMDTVFSDLKKSHSLIIPYAHGVHPAGNQDVTPNEWNNFKNRLQNALSEGWLQATTFENLWSSSGGRFTNLGGYPVAQYMDATGDTISKRLL